MVHIVQRRKEGVEVARRKPTAAHEIEAPIFRTVELFVLVALVQTN